jgi:glycosyltransferase involved in cell wall biosynthesis
VSGYKNYIIPAFAPCKIVTTIHDVIPLTVREYHVSSPHALWYRYNYACSARRSDLIVVISKFTGNELLRFYPECRDKLRVIHQGCDPDFGACHTGDSAREAMRAFGIGTPYVLSMGGAEPRKNVQGLVDAFAADPLGYHSLVIVGNLWRGLTLRIPAGAAGTHSRRTFTDRACGGVYGGIGLCFSIPL